jgi:hypothetical protein
MGTPLNLQSLSDEGLAVRLPDGKWALTPQGIGGHVLDGPLTALSADPRFASVRRCRPARSGRRWP